MPYTPFTDRGKLVEAALRFSGVRVPHMDDMAVVDAEISDKVDRLNEVMQGPSDQQLADAGARWAVSKAATKNSDLAAILTGPSSTLTPKRCQQVREGAKAALVSKAEKQRPQWTIRGLIDELRPQVQQALNDMAVEATQSLRDLPAAGVEFMSQSYADAVNIADSLIDGSTTPVDDIAAYRRATTAWQQIEQGAPCSDPNIPRYGDIEYETLAVAMARGIAQDPSEMDLNRPRELDKYGTAGYFAPWLNVDGMAARFMGLNPSKIVFHGLGELSPLADPLGKDSDELQARIAAWEDARGFLAEQLRINTPRLYGTCPEAIAQAYDAANVGRAGSENRLNHAGFNDSFEAVRAYRDYKARSAGIDDDNDDSTNDGWE